jgi:hypothetical protein
MSPPVPTHLAHRPTHGGLVVPWVSVVLADGTPALGNLHGTRADKAFWNKLCQICGEAMTRPIVLFATESGHARGQTSEPGMHPECAAYSAKACPMVNGRMSRYQGSDRVAGKPCVEPGCDCGGWVDQDGGPTPGAPAELWFAVWVEDYQIGVGTDGRPNAAIYANLTPLKVRPLAAVGCPA